MKKETFVNAINAIQHQMDRNWEIAVKLSAAFPDCEPDKFMFYDYSGDALTSVLQEAMNDTELDEMGNTWISWFCFETEFGKNDNHLEATDKHGKAIELKDAGELYDFLVSDRR